MEQKEFAENLPMETPKVSKEKASKLRDMFNRAKESIKNSKAGKNAAEFYAKHEKGVKIGGGVAAGTALAAGLAVGAKKLADKKKEQQKEFARADYEGLSEEGAAYLRKKRNKLAKNLREAKNTLLEQVADKETYAKDLKGVKTLKFNNRFDSDRGAKGIKVSTKVTTKLNKLSRDIDKARAHYQNGVRSLLTSAKQITPELRAEAFRNVEGKSDLQNVPGTRLGAVDYWNLDRTRENTHITDLNKLPANAEQKRLERSANKGFKDPLLVNKETRLNRLKKLRDSRERLKKLEDSHASYNRHSKIADELRAKKLMGQKLKKAGYVGLGVAGAAGLAYGGKKLYDKYKKSNESDNKD